MSKGSTRKKVKVIGQETYINQQTGELVEMNVVNIEERDANFEKIWLGHIVEAIDMIGNAKIKVLTHLLRTKTSDNIIIESQRDIAQSAGVSLQTVNVTMRALQDANVIKKVKNVYMLNPDCIFKGGKSQRLDVLLRYSQESEVQDEKSNVAKIPVKPKTENQVLDPIPDSSSYKQTNIFEM